MNKEKHSESCEIAFGNSFAEVHEFLDQYCRTYPREHRKVYHHRQGLAIVAERFGLQAVKAAERHIIEDEGCIPDDHTYYHTENEELDHMVRQIYASAKESGNCGNTVLAGVPTGQSQENKE